MQNLLLTKNDQTNNFYVIIYHIIKDKQIAHNIKIVFMLMYYLSVSKW